MIATLALLSLIPLPQEPQGTQVEPAVGWQRNLDDALAVGQATGRPLLICVNLDGEPASERFVRTKYFNAAFVRLTTAFVPVIASVNRHSPQDFDAHGHRIHCPRFGIVTCGEHIALEPVVFERYFDNERVAPRHIGGGLDGRQLFDRKLENDISLVDRSLRQHGEVREAVAVPTDPDELLKSRDSRYRMAIEVR